MSKKRWFEKWFNKDYINLYTSHDQNEAEQHVKFIIEALKLKGNERILDLGCGMGRHSFAFGKRGFEVVGVDLSPYLIEQAKKTAVKNVTFLEQDMFQLKDIGTFDCVINVFTSFGYFDSDEKNSSILKIVREHLNPGGQFFMDYLHPEQVKRDLIPREEKVISGEKIVIEKCIEGDQVIKTITYPDRSYTEKVKLYTRNQIESMLKQYHFEVISVFNDYRGNPWSPEGDRQIFCCRLVSRAETKDGSA